MVLKILGVVANSLLSSSHYVHVIISILAIVIVHAFAQGRTTNRERDMHARVVLVTVRSSFICLFSDAVFSHRLLRAVLLRLDLH